MKPKTDPRVDAFIGKSAEFAQPILRHLRKLVHAACPDVHESIKWGMPSFLYEGKILCGMAAFKAHAAFGFWHRGMAQALGAAGKKAEEAMGNLGRITKLSDLPPDTEMKGYIRQAMNLITTGVPAREKSKPKKPLPVPADFRAALKTKRSAAKNFDSFAPGQRRDYIEWITEAKREETRSKRIATAVAWIAEGKRRNWQYDK
jgi:uncharacterized protein YdeI (YjbR/CyaY-like superfamily)